MDGIVCVGICILAGTATAAAVTGFTFGVAELLHRLDDQSQEEDDLEQIAHLEQWAEERRTK